MKKFIHRHNQWFTLIGALIVFLTFIVNDVLRDRLKEVASSIAGAQSFFSNKSDIQLLHSDIQDLAITVQNLFFNATPALMKCSGLRPVVEEANRQLPIVPSWVPPFIPRDIQLLVGTAERLAQSASVSLDHGSQLIRKMPEDKSTANELQSLRTEWNDLAKRQADIQYRLTEVEFGKPPHKENYTPHPNEVRAIQTPLKECAIAEIRWSHSANKFVNQILKSAEETRDREERSYKRYTYFSWFLYSLGWGLATVGKLYGGIESEAE